MDDITWQKIVSLSAVAAEKNFAKDIFSLLSDFADIAYFGVFVFNKNRLNESELALYAGTISDYWMKLNTKNYKHYSQIKNIIVDKNLSEIDSRKQTIEGFFRFAPDQYGSDEIKKIYKRSHIREKYYYLKERNNKLYQFNLYRSEDNGPFKTDEIERLKKIVPLITNLVLLRFQICGIDEYQRRPQRAAVSYMKERGIHTFDRLSKREAEVCDLIIYGLTTEGIASELNLSISSVKTFRNRAYKKF